MKTEFMVPKRADRNGRIFLAGRVAIALMATFFLTQAAARAADPGGPAPVGKSPVVTLESIPGSTAKRVILTAKSAGRLGIETGKVGEKPIALKQMVSGLVIPPMEKRPAPKPSGGMFGGFERGAAAPASPGGVFGGFGQVASASAAQAVTQAAPAPRPASPVAGNVWVLVTLSQAEWDRLAKNKTARILPLATRDKPGKIVFARPSGIEPLEDMKRSMMSLYYVVPGKDHGLTVNDRMRVELQLSGSNEKKKVVPYGSVYYDAKGAAWVYVNTKPHVFERRRIVVERIVGDLAVLTDGPPVETPVVTVGAALLYGAEIFGK